MSRDEQLIPFSNIQGAEQLIAAAEEFCLAEQEDGLVCTEWPNHRRLAPGGFGRATNRYVAAGDIVKWRIQQELFSVRSFDPPTPMWVVYPPERNRPPWMFSSWRAAIQWVEDVA